MSYAQDSMMNRCGGDGKVMGPIHLRDIQGQSHLCTEDWPSGLLAFACSFLIHFAYFVHCCVLDLEKSNWHVIDAQKVFS